MSRELSVNVPSTVWRDETIHIHVRLAVDVYFLVEITDDAPLPPQQQPLPSTKRAISVDDVASAIRKSTSLNKQSIVDSTLDEDERLARQLQAELDEQDVKFIYFFFLFFFLILKKYFQ